MNRAIVVIPTYNEKDNIEKITQAVLSLEPGFDILFVDDNSPDGTGKLAGELARAHPEVHLLSRSSKRGLGTAYIDGFKWALEAGYEFIFEMDADFSHDPKYLPDILNKIEDGDDLVLGSRYLDGISVVRWALHRVIISYLANKYVQLITGMKYTDCLGGFKCFRREVLEKIDLDKIVSHGYVFQMEMLYRAHKLKFKISEVPIIFLARVSGLSKMSFKEVWEAFITVLRMPFII